MKTCFGNQIALPQGVRSASALSVRLASHPWREGETAGSERAQQPVRSGPTDQTIRKQNVSRSRSNYHLGSSKHGLEHRVGLAAILSAAVILASCDSRPESDVANLTETPRDSSAMFDLEELRPRVASLCGACHTYPEPSDFPKRYWAELVDQAYGWYRESPRADLKALDAPPIEDVIWYYTSQAPDEVDLPSPNPQIDMGGLRFRQQTVPLSEDDPFSAVAHLRWWPSQDKRQRSLLMCDMGSGNVQQIFFDGRRHRKRVLAELEYPDHVEPCDLDGDGHIDFIVADLGSFQPADHDRGRVIWVRWDAVEQSYVSIVIRERLGRVADVQAADFDSDGDLDLVVAEFGWRKTGRVLLFEQVESATISDRFRMHVLDERHGAIHVPVVDLNNDGLLDFVVLIAQEHETIVANLNRGDMTFEMQQIFGAPCPSYGSSGIQLTDLDSDGDIDVLYTNGDSFDTFCLQPYHSVQWFENRGGYPFERHVIANVPGAYRALAGDLDNDGDRDIALCCWTGLLSTPQNGLIWFEQQEGRSFVRHNLEYSVAQHATLEVGDFDGNGYVDLAVGHYVRKTSSRHDAWLTFWWNEGPEERDSTRTAE